MKDQNNPWKLGVFLLVGVIVGYGLGQVLPMSSEVSLLGADSESKQGGDKEVTIQVVDEDDVPEIVEVSIEDDAVLGDPDAPITIIEFSDYQCSYCQRFHVNTFPDLKENYIDTGLVNFVYRDFPLSFHQNSQVAAEAAECAGEQDAYWEMHDALFENLSEWSSSSDAEALFAVYAEELGLDADDLTACMVSDDMLNEINADMSDAIEAGVTATPSFYINGEQIVGAQPYSVFSSIIDSLLEK